MNWLEVFRQNSNAKRLFDYSIPATVKKRSVNDFDHDLSDADTEECTKTTLGHIAIVSRSEMIKERFVDVLSKQYLYESDFKRVYARAVKKEEVLASILAILEPGDTLVFEMNAKTSESVVKQFCTALREFELALYLDNDKGGQITRIELPPFTTVFYANTIDDIPSKIMDELDNVIEINPDQEILEELQIREEASEFDVQLTEGTLALIKEFYAKTQIKNTRRIMRFITDYIYIHPEFRQPLSEDCIQTILELLGN